MEIVHALVLGVIEGVTEFLPISSTAHLLITGKLLGLPETDFFKTFVIAIQSGALLAVATLYTQKILRNKKLLFQIFVAFLPTALIGFLLYPLIKNILFENFTIIAWALLLGGIFMLFLEKRMGTKEEVKTVSTEEVLTYKKSFLIGVAQALAVIPGVSRSGATIIGGLVLGIPRVTIVEFSFLLALPTIFAATGFDLLKTPVETFTLYPTILLLGILFSFICALVAIRFFIRFVSTHSFAVFAYYRIVLGAILLLFL